MTRYLVIGTLLFLFVTHIYADECDLTDDDFPASDDDSSCSFDALNINLQELRFGRLSIGTLDGFGSIGPFARLGSRVYSLDENIEVYDTRTGDDDCDVDQDAFFNESVAFILDDDSLNAPRVITQMWILDCEINSTR